ncbi:MAG: magnesium/cobalt transporter CorA [Acidobacteria bacterium]|nr:magnesium/cobalt transporter CorA [Acidobacteriota bacterium]MCA1651881.1 magnesium/cobalt transporter CorA [Acidobacteriota bacterium]
MITIYKHEKGSTQKVDSVDPVWLRPGSGVWVWVDLDKATAAESRILTDTFHFHELAVEDALAESHHPKIESYGDYLYLILHGINFKAREHMFETHDIDFFLGSQYLVTVHPGVSRSLAKIRDVCRRNDHALGEGPGALLHRIVDAMVDNYRPEVDHLSDRLDKLEREVLQRPDVTLSRQILNFKRDVSSLRRVVLPQRDAMARLARREYPQITEGLAFRFRDVYDHLVRISDEAMFFQDRLGSLLEAHLATVSNQLNTIMKVLTVLSTIFMPLTVLTGMYGMNVPLPHFPGGDALQFWWISAIMVSVIGVMLWAFNRKGWI